MSSDYTLHDAIEEGDIDRLQRLLSPAFDEAYDPTKPDDVELPSLDRRDQWKCTPLHLAIFHRSLPAMKLCLQKGAEVLTTLDGSHLIHVVLAMGQFGPELDSEFCLPALEVLAANDVPMLLNDDRGRSPWHFCAEYNLQRCAEYLLKEVGQEALHNPDLDGNTPLHLAYRSQSEALISWLKSHGAPVDLKNVYGQVPADLSPTTEDSAGDTLLLTHPLCFAHKTARSESRSVPQMPDNPVRLRCLLDPKVGTLMAPKAKAHLLLARNPRKAAITDVLRVHEYPYLRKLAQAMGSLSPYMKSSSRKEDDTTPVAAMELGKATSMSLQEVFASDEARYPEAAASAKVGVGLLDPDTAVCRASWDAALRAAGAVCDAVDAVMSGSISGEAADSHKVRNAFCVTRPAGHHAGPSGPVPSEQDPNTSHGFCLLNNVAIGAGYALAKYQTKGLKRIAIVDFDVHHGNGTEAIVRALKPVEEEHRIALPFIEMGSVTKVTYKPWTSETDGDNVLFASLHGYGPQTAEELGISSRFAGAVEGAGETKEGGGGREAGATDPDLHEEIDELLRKEPWFYPASGPNEGHSWDWSTTSSSSNANDPLSSLKQRLYRPKQAEADSPAYNPYKLLEKHIAQPTIINVGVPHKLSRVGWRKVMLRHVLQPVADFKPDIIFISAGFDAHLKDVLNQGYGTLLEDDYRWATEQLVKIANTHCQGRVVSVLEGGYRIHGGPVSAFARSVAEHVQGLRLSTKATWNGPAEVQALEAYAAAVERTSSDVSGGTVHPSAATSDDRRSAEPRRSKRRRVAVDYEALEKQLQAEEAAARKIKEAEKTKQTGIAALVQGPLDAEVDGDDSAAQPAPAPAPAPAPTPAPAPAPAPAASAASGGSKPLISEGTAALLAGDLEDEDDEDEEEYDFGEDDEDDEDDDDEGEEEGDEDMDEGEEEE